MVAMASDYVPKSNNLTVVFGLAIQLSLSEGVNLFQRCMHIRSYVV